VYCHFVEEKAWMQWVWEKQFSLWQNKMEKSTNKNISHQSMISARRGDKFIILWHDYYLKLPKNHF